MGSRMFVPLFIFLFSILKLSKGQSSPAFPYGGLLERATEEPSPRNGSTRSGCPEWDELPKVWDKKFIATRQYRDDGHDIPALSCNGPFWERTNGYQVSSSPGRCFGVGTIFVHAGCTMYGFHDYNYQGHYTTLEGPLFMSRVPVDTFGGWAVSSTLACVPSYILDCRMHYPDCVPSDDWETVASFDNSNSHLDSTFTYKYTIGTSWSHEMSEGMSIDATVSAEMSAAFWDIFEVKLGFSITTGYNWNEVSTEAKSEIQEFTVKTDVPAGESIQIQQTKGKCGGSTVNTEMFRLVSTDRAGIEKVSVI